MRTKAVLVEYVEILKAARTRGGSLHHAGLLSERHSAGWDAVDEALDESFPASDPPAFLFSDAKKPDG